MNQRFWEKVDKSGKCWLWKASTNGGYGQFRYNGKIVRAHRFSYAQKFGICPDDLFVCHTCDNPLCVNPDHLFLGTDAVNKADMRSKNRHVFGERHPNRVLTKEVVIAIRHDAEIGIPQRVIANKFNTQRSQVSLIVNRKRWASI